MRRQIKAALARGAGLGRAGLGGAGLGGAGLGEAGRRAKARVTKRTRGRCQKRPHERRCLVVGHRKSPRLLPRRAAVGGRASGERGFGTGGSRASGGT